MLLAHPILPPNSLPAKSDTYGLAFPACSASTVQLGLGVGGENPVSPIAVQSRASIIEVEVPVGDLTRLPLSIGEQIVNRYADSQDIQTEHGWGTNAKLVTDLPASNVRAIVQVGDERFRWLTNCAGWDDPV
jgi:hypothetical protein